MAAEGRNFYEAGLANEEEAKRLQALQAPTEFTMELLGDLTGVEVLDVGAGASTETGQRILTAGGRYVAVDVWPKAVAAQQSISGEVEAVQGSILDLSTLFAGRRFHTGHARNVICHLPPADRPKAIAELLKICDRVVIIEYIGCTVRGTPGARDFQAALRGIFYEPSIHFQPFMERELISLAQEVADQEHFVLEWRRPSPPGDHFDALISAGQNVIGHTIGDVDYLKRRMQRAIDLLTEEREAYRSGEPYELYGPDLMAADIRRRPVIS